MTTLDKIVALLTVASMAYLAGTLYEVLLIVPGFGFWLVAVPILWYGCYNIYTEYVEWRKDESRD